jgi:hypothetical protein
MVCSPLFGCSIAGSGRGDDLQPLVEAMLLDQRYLWARAERKDAGSVWL